jgi:hypothetical protein
MILRLNTNLYKEKNSEKGVTLLLTLLVMAAISTIIFATAGIAVNELRTSADVTKSEPSITGAQASAEDYLYAGIRGSSTLANCSNPATTNYSSGTVVTSCASLYQDNPYVFNLDSSENRYFYLYDPTNFNNGGGYTSVSISITDGSSATVYLCDYTVPDCVAGPYVSTGTLNMSSGSSTWNSPNLDGSSKYQLIVVNGVLDGDFVMQSSPQGLPSGTTKIDTTGTSQGVTRKLQTELPQ